MKMQTRSAAVLLRGGAQGLLIAPLIGFGMMWHHLAVTPPSLCSAASIGASTSSVGIPQLVLPLLLFEMACLAAVAAGWTSLMRANRQDVDKFAGEESASFMRAGATLLPLGLVMSFGMILHCIARHAAGASFVANASLWQECPWALSTLAVLGGSIGMIGIGLDGIVRERSGPRGAAAVCAFALAAMFFTGYAGYFVVGQPGFYYLPAGQDVWLLVQLACMILYTIGALASWFRSSQYRDIKLVANFETKRH